MNEQELGRVKYHTLIAADEIVAYVHEVAGKEWEPSDFDVYGTELENSVWSLEEVPVREITFGPSHPSEEDLKPRINSILVAIEQGSSIPPLILRGTDYLIFDGYARTYAFRSLGIDKCLAYIGRKPD